MGPERRGERDRLREDEAAPELPGDQLAAARLPANHPRRCGVDPEQNARSKETNGGGGPVHPLPHARRGECRA
eukprot:16034710-Heterocapsa_arctica.AAC.1